jgi:hypothetical protein
MLSATIETLFKELNPLLKPLCNGFTGVGYTAMVFYFIAIDTKQQFLHMFQATTFYI